MKVYNFYINIWNIMLYVLLLIQIYSGVTQGHILQSLWSVALIWAIFMIGYNSLDRELDIKLKKALDAMKAENE